jgi:diguanylate cyclase (GGDEF)-like protein
MTHSSPIKKPVRSYIGLRLSLYAVIISLFFAAISVVLLIYIESNQAEKELVRKTSEIVDTIEQQIGQYLWDIDDNGIQTTLQSVVELPYIKSASIEGGLGNNFYVGEQDTPEKISRDIFLYEQELGVLEIGYNVEEFKNNAYKKYRSTIFIVLFIIGLMSLVFYVIVNREIIRHITFISHSAKLFSLYTSVEFFPLYLQRKVKNDEIDDLVEVLNDGRKSAVELFHAKKDYEEQMAYQANFDLLTGLPNRRHLYTYLNQQLEEYDLEKGRLAILFIDLDGFKQVNDSMGHNVGDKVLNECAMRLQKIASDFSAYISRLGGDEFVICFYLENDQSYVDACEAIIDGFDEKISTQGIHVKLGCSIGVTIHPDHGSSEPRTILSYADNALCKAKIAGKNTFFCFDESTRKEQELENKIKSKLHDAIEKNLFHVNYQPLINIQTNKVVGFEALIRWKDEEIGWVRPDIFIAIAEKIGVVFDIDRWIFETSIEQVKKWRKQFETPFILSINFSPTNFYHNDFSSWLSAIDAAQKNKLDWIELEVTERLVLNDDPIVSAGIKKIRERGISFSIDDFGMGYSSLGYIKKFSHMLSKIKIDRMFINEILETDFDIAFVKSIMMLSDSLKLTVLAEGVEEKGQVELLRKVGCEYVQGYYFSKPLPVSDMKEFLDGWEMSIASEMGMLMGKQNNSSLKHDNNNEVG